MTGARFTAIALLGGALAGCAATPKPAPRRADPQLPWADDFGDVVIQDHEPERRRRELISSIETDATKCAFRADSEGRHGEVRLTLRIVERGLATEGDLRRELTVEAESTAGLTGDDRQCVEQAGHTVFEEWVRRYVGPEGLAEPVTVYVAIGKAAPALPDAPKLIADWQAGTQSAPARERFARRLPAEIVLGDDGCLTMPERPIFVDGIERWLAGLDQPLDEMWQPPAPRSGIVKDALFDGLGPRAAPGARGYAYLIDDRTVLLYHRDVGSAHGQALCLLPLDEKLRQELQARIDRRGTCWVGELRELLLHPRTGVPAGQRFRTVAAAPARVCAIDERGETVCCGERQPQPPPATEYGKVSGTAARTCRIGADGSVGCDGGWPVAQTPAGRNVNDAVIQVWSTF